ncbi:MAG: type II secretion system major pseudopilin GspG [Planctomycetes bacterium]|nr:type II secretion system major pseudopilin GspG [Planctomycetota bacterium]
MPRHKGFTLMEIILVVVIIGMLAVIVMQNMDGVMNKARTSTAKSELATLHAALKRYEAEAAAYPTTAEGLEALVTKPASWPQDVTWQRFLDRRSVPKDPWKQPYVYRCPGTLNTDSYDLLCAGPDRTEDTDDDIDITE